MNTTNQQSVLKRRASKEFAGLLSYAYLYDATTVIHKDGGFSAHFRYVAQDVDSSTGAILDANAKALMQALGLLDDGWMVETNLISCEDTHYAKPGSFPNVVSALIDDARRYHFEHSERFYTSTCYLSLTFVPSDQLGKKFSKLLLDIDQKTQTIEDEHTYFEHTVERFMTQFQKLIAGQQQSGRIKTLHRLSEKSAHLTRLAGDALVSFLNHCITGEERHLQSPSTGYFLDAYLSSQHFIAGMVPKLGDRWVSVLCLDDLPESTTPAILDTLNFLGFEYRWSSRFIALSQSTAEKYLKSLRTRWSNKAIGLMGALKLSMGITPQRDEAALDNKALSSLALRENNAGSVRYGFMTSVIVMMHPEQQALDGISEQITRSIEALGYKVRREYVNATEGYLGSLPGHGVYNVRKPLVDSHYVSHALPTSSVWQGSTSAPCPFYPKDAPALLYLRTKGSRSFRFNLHVGDVGHFVVLGPTGTGKSTLLGLLGCQFQKYPEARVIVLDKDYSNRSWLRALGGMYVDVYGSSAFAPLALLGQYVPSSPEYEAELTFLVSWLREICELQGVEITPERVRRIADSLRALAQSGQEHLTLDLLHIQDASVREAIAVFNSGAVQTMMNGVSDSMGEHTVLGLEMGELLKLPESLYIPIVRALFHRFTHLFQDRKPTLLILEEAWSFLRHSIFEDMLEDWLLTLRKFNVSVGFVSQNLDHVSRSRISGTIKESCPTKIYLPNHTLNDSSVANKYLDFGLNAQQLEIIARAIPKQDYYMTSPLGNRLVQLDMSPLELAFISMNAPEDSEQFEKLYDPQNSHWVARWLEYKGLSEWADYAKTHYGEDNLYA